MTHRYFSFGQRSTALTLVLVVGCSSNSTVKDPTSEGGSAGSSSSESSSCGGVCTLPTTGRGGATARGGSSSRPGESTGGVTAKGGASSTEPVGGAQNVGGQGGTGFGGTSTNSTSGTGGKATGGAASTGGTKATGGTSSTGGTKATGGTSSTGGTKATGGTSSTTPSNCKDLQGTITSITAGTYCVRGDVIVPAGTTLNIPAGTTFIFMGRYHFGRDPALPDGDSYVTGSIHAIGTASAPIVFRGETASTAWYGIAVSNSSDTVHFEYVTVSDTYKDDQSPDIRIWRRGGALSSYRNMKGTIIRHCTFTNNRAWSVAGALDINSNGQYPSNGLIEITNSAFENNSCDCGIYTGTSVDLCGGGAIRFSHIGGDEKVIKISNNVFRNNEAKRTNGIDAFGGAIGGFDSALLIGAGNLFEGNKATGSGALSCANQSTVGEVIDFIDASNVFTNNSPNNGCGK